MAKKTHNKEFTDNQRLKEENKRLRTQVSKLRKVINNIDMSHYSFVQDLLNSKDFEAKPAKVTKEEVEKKWQCFNCEDGIMRLLTFSKMGDPYYMRKCDSCDHKTKVKKYTEDVKGV